MKKQAFEIFLGTEGLNQTFQEDFPEITKCCRCGKEARIGFVAAERGPKPGEKIDFLCDLHDNKPQTTGFWLHDCCAVAVYFCKACLEPTALYNQA